MMKFIHPGMKACMADGGTATVTDVLIDPHDGGERYVVLCANGVFGPDVVVPFSAVWRVDDHVHLTLSSHDVATSPCFTPVLYCREQGLCSRAAGQRGAGWHHKPEHAAH
jgi:hypothetical protein